MRTALAAALLALALPALAQDAPVTDDEEIVVDIESIAIDTTFADGRAIRIEVERDGDAGDERRIVIRRHGGDDGERVFRLDMPDVERMAPFRDLDGPLAFFDGEPFQDLLRGLGGQPGVSSETRQRMRDLQAEARSLARQVRDGDDGAEARLDAVLGELFDVRAEARRERADGLRERARELMEEADEMEAALREREARRQALIEARRARLLGDPASDW